MRLGCSYSLSPSFVFCKCFYLLIFSPVCNGQCSGVNTPALLNVSSTTTDELKFQNISLENRTLFPRRSLFSQETNDFIGYLKGLDLKIIPGYNANEELETWIPPLYLQRDMPIYISGFDNQNRPILILEWGQWKFGKYAQGNRTVRAEFQRYMRYLAYYALKAQGIKSTKEKRVDQHVIMFDLESVQLDYLVNRKVLQFQTKLASDFRRYYEKHVGKVVVINVNSVGELLLNLARPFYLRILDKMEVYGTNKAIWAPKLLKIFPQDQLPEWYGGKTGFKPLCVMG